MSVKTCKQHANEPIFIYAQCAACEIQRYRNQADELKAEISGLRTGYEAYHQVNADLKPEVEALKGQIGRLDKLDTLQIIAEQARQIETLRKDARLLNILVEAMAEVKATSDGESDQPIADIVSGCLAEIAAISSPENHA